MRGSAARLVVAVGATSLLVAALSGCRAARDPDLDQRVALALQAPPEAETPPEATAEAKPAKKRDPAAPPPKGIVEQRTYTDDQIEQLLTRVPGEGPHLRVTIQTEDGPIRCALDADAAPQTVANFVALATGARKWRDPDTGEVQSRRFYDGLPFHRCISNFIIQTGNPGSTGAAGPGWTLPREDGIPGAYEQPGVMGMVDAGDDSHGSQFFITLRASKNLAEDYTPFGTCGDLDLVRGISNVDKHPASKAGKSATKPKRPIRIESVTVARGD